VILNNAFVKKLKYNVNKKTQVYRKLHPLDPFIFTEVSKALQFLETLTIYYLPLDAA
jgi:predicted AAA+ superfamily ATPase